MQNTILRPPCFCSPIKQEAKTEYFFLWKTKWSAKYVGVFLQWDHHSHEAAPLQSGVKKI